MLNYLLTLSVPTYAKLCLDGIVIKIFGQKPVGLGSNTDWGALFIIL